MLTYFELMNSLIVERDLHFVLTRKRLGRRTDDKCESCFVVCLFVGLPYVSPAQDYNHPTGNP